MEWTLDALTEAFSPVDEIGNETMTIPVGTTSITMRILLPEEDSKVQKAAAVSDRDTSETADVTDAIDYIERFRVEVLSRAIIAVGNQDFRDVTFIETGEVLDNGQKVKIPLHLAMRKIVLKWPAPTRIQLFKNYSELLSRMEQNVEKFIKYEPADLETELERAKTKVAKIEQEIEKRKKPVSMGIMSGQVHAIAQDGTQEDSVDAESPVEEETPEPVVETPKVTPSVAVAPKAVPTGLRVPIRPMVAPPPMTPPTGQPVKRQAQPGDDIPDSFISADDTAAVDAENRRQFEMWQRKGQGLPPAPGEIHSALDDVRRSFGTRRAPHVAAAETVTALASETFPENTVPDDSALFGSRISPDTEVLTHRPEVSPVVPVRKDTRNPRFNPRKD